MVGAPDSFAKIVEFVVGPVEAILRLQAACFALFTPYGPNTTNDVHAISFAACS